MIRCDLAWGSTSAAKHGRIYVSTNNSLLQAGTDIGHTIEEIRKDYLHNWPR